MQTVRPASWALKSRLSSPATLVNVLTPQNVDSSRDSKTMFTLRYSKASATAHDGMWWMVAAGDVAVGGGRGVGGGASRGEDGGGRGVGMYRGAHRTSRTKKPPVRNPAHLRKTHQLFFFFFFIFQSLFLIAAPTLMRESLFLTWWRLETLAYEGSS